MRQQLHRSKLNFETIIYNLKILNSKLLACKDYKIKKRAID